MKYCSKCGNELFDEAVVCPKCGCATEQSAKKQQKQANPNAAKGAALIVAGILVIVLFIVLVVSQL